MKDLLAYIVMGGVFIAPMLMTIQGSVTPVTEVASVWTPIICQEVYVPPRYETVRLPSGRSVKMEVIPAQVIALEAGKKYTCNLAGISAVRVVYRGLQP